MTLLREILLTLFLWTLLIVLYVPLRVAYWVWWGGDG